MNNAAPPVRPMRSGRFLKPVTAPKNTNNPTPSHSPCKIEPTTGRRVQNDIRLAKPRVAHAAWREPAIELIRPGEESFQK